MVSKNDASKKNFMPPCSTASGPQNHYEETFTFYHYVFLYYLKNSSVTQWVLPEARFLVWYGRKEIRKNIFACLFSVYDSRISAFCIISTQRFTETSLRRLDPKAHFIGSFDPVTVLFKWNLELSNL